MNERSNLEVGNWTRVPTPAVAEGPEWNTGCPRMGALKGALLRAARPLRIPTPGRVPVESVRITAAVRDIGPSSNCSFSEPVAAVALFCGAGMVHRFEIEAGRHCQFPGTSVTESRTGDGFEFESLGAIMFGDVPSMVQRWVIHLPDRLTIDRIDLAPSSSQFELALFDVETLCVGPITACPFHSSQSGVALAEIPAAVRLGDRDRIRQAIAQLDEGLRKSHSEDEARGEGLLFVAILVAAFLERGGHRSMHTLQLEFARRLERCTTIDEIASATTHMATEIAAPLMEAQATPVEKLIDNALAYIDRHYAKDISDADVARRIGLSTSYFRQVFRSATGQPFHRYLIGLRLEKARILLSEAGASVAQAADAVGFQNPAHFSRAFSQRFGGSPMRFRRG